MDDKGPKSDTLELDLIEYLLKKRSVSPQTAKREEAIMRDYRAREGKKAIMKALKRLMNLGIVGRTKKGKESKIHYYVDPGEAKRILFDPEGHNYVKHN
jgi:predicted transcriptional regulator